MERVQTTEQAATVDAVFEDPVTYLGSLGIEAELVTVVEPTVAPAA